MKLSIIICNFNYDKFLNQAIQSAFDISYNNKDIFVVDDGSTDNSRAILGGWESKVTVIYKENGGQISAYNTGFAACSGDLVIFLDSDDTLDANLMEIVVPSFEDNNVVKVHFKMRLINEAGNPTGAIIPTNLSSGLLSQHILNKGWLHFSSPGSGNIYRANPLKQLFPLPSSDEDKHGADFFCIYGICFFGEVKSVNSVLAGYRVHNSRTSNSQNVSLVFGNAAKTVDEVTHFKRRAIRFINWINQRTNGDIVVEKIMTDFSIVKQRFVREIFEKKNYLEGFQSGLKLMPKLVRSIFIRVHFSILKKLLLLCWSLAILVLPRNIGIKLAVRVSNPASR